MRLTSNDGRRRDAYASTDPRMIAWLLMIVCAPFFRVMLYAAAVYGLAFVVVPGTITAWRDRAGAPLDGPGDGRERIVVRAVLAAGAVVAAGLGAATHAGPTWWWTVAGFAALAVGLHVAARAR